MVKENQKILYEHYKKLSKEGSGAIAKNAELHAKEILKSCPEFEIKEKVKSNDTSK